VLGSDSGRFDIYALWFCFLDLQENTVRPWIASGGSADIFTEENDVYKQHISFEAWKDLKEISQASNHILIHLFFAYWRTPFQPYTGHTATDAILNPRYEIMWKILDLTFLY